MDQVRSRSSLKGFRPPVDRFATASGQCLSDKIADGMGVTIELQNLGDAQLCRDITAHLEHAFSEGQGQWRVSIGRYKRGIRIRHHLSPRLAVRCAGHSPLDDRRFKWNFQLSNQIFDLSSLYRCALCLSSDAIPKTQPAVPFECGSARPLAPPSERS